jgi:RNA polymerase sigma-70 factor (ECF subfamily)
MSQAFSEQLREMYEADRDALYGYAVAITGDRGAAEDAIHEAFRRLMGRGRAPAELRPYVFRCVRNAAIDERRRAHHGASDGPFEESADVAGTDGIRAGEWNAMLRRLGDDERETIALKVFDALTFREIAEARGVPLHTAASWYRRGLEKLRAMLAKEGI